MDDMTPEKPRPAQTTSDVLRGVLDHAPDPETISVREIIDALGDRAHAIIMILFCLPNCVPVPPGVGLVFGFPMLLVAVQMMIGRHKPWLPEALLVRRLKRADYARMMDLAEPWFKKAEAYLKPRYTMLFSNLADRLMGFFFALCAISVILPLPGSNFVPALASVIVCLAMIEEDGLILVTGLAIGIAGLTYTTVFGSAIIYGGWLATKALFGL